MPLDKPQWLLRDLEDDITNCVIHGALTGTLLLLMSLGPSIVTLTLGLLFTLGLTLMSGLAFSSPGACIAMAAAALRLNLALVGDCRHSWPVMRWFVSFLCFGSFVDVSRGKLLSRIL